MAYALGWAFGLVLCLGLLAIPVALALLLLRWTARATRSVARSTELGMRDAMPIYRSMIERIAR